MGYGGTKKEMQRLLEDAEKITGIHYDISNLSDVYSAIHVIQQEIGITGTTAEEAQKTMQGSTKAMKASWQNLLTGIADDNADLGQLVSVFAENLVIMLQNALPKIQTIVGNIGSLIAQLMTTIFPEIIKMLPPLVSELIPALETTIFAIVDALIALAPSVIQMLVDIIPQLVTAILAMTPQLIQAGIDLFVGLVQGFTEALPILAQMLPDIIVDVINLLMDNLPLLVDVVIQLAIATIDGLIQALPILIERLPEILEHIWNALVEIWNQYDLTEFFTGIWDAITGFFNGIFTWIDDNIVQPVANFLKGVANWINEHVIQPIKRFFQPLIDFFTSAWNVIKELATGCWEVIKEVWSRVSTWFNDHIIQPIANFFTGMWDGLKSGATKAWDGIKSVFGAVADWFKNIFSKAWQKVKDVFSAGGKIFDGIKDGIVNAFKTVVNAIIKGINKVIAIPFNAINGILGKIQGISIFGISPFKNLVSRLKVPQIPLLAKGGVLDKGARLMMAGEDGAEAVVPLEKNTQWIERVAGELKTALTLPKDISTALSAKEERYSYDDMVNAFKDALTQVKVVLDDNEMGTFIDKTVTNLIYA